MFQLGCWRPELATPEYPLAPVAPPWPATSLFQPCLRCRCRECPAGTTPRPSGAPSPAPTQPRNPRGSAWQTEPWLHCRSEEHTSELQSRGHLVCRLLLEKKKREH